MSSDPELVANQQLIEVINPLRKNEFCVRSTYRTMPARAVHAVLSRNLLLFCYVKESFYATNINRGPYSPTIL